MHTHTHTCRGRRRYTPDYTSAARARARALGPSECPCRGRRRRCCRRHLGMMNGRACGKQCASQCTSVCECARTRELLATSTHTQQTKKTQHKTQTGARRRPRRRAKPNKKRTHRTGPGSGNIIQTGVYVHPHIMKGTSTRACVHACSGWSGSVVGAIRGRTHTHTLSGP